MLSLKEYLEEVRVCSKNKQKSLAKQAYCLQELKQRCTRLQCALTETETRVRDLGEQLNNEKKARDNAEDKRYNSYQDNTADRFLGLMETMQEILDF